MVDIGRANPWADQPVVLCRLPPQDGPNDASRGCGTQGLTGCFSTVTLEIRNDLRPRPVSQLPLWTMPSPWSAGCALSAQQA